MDVCCSLIIDRDLRLEPLQPKRVFAWGETDEKPELRWGPFVVLRKSTAPEHDLRQLPAGLGPECYVIDGPCLDMLAAEATGAEVDWKGHSLVQFLREAVAGLDRWAFVWDTYCDQVDFVEEVSTMEDVIARLVDILRGAKRLGFMAYRRSA